MLLQTSNENINHSILFRQTTFLTKCISEIIPSDTFLIIHMHLKQNGKATHMNSHMVIFPASASAFVEFHTSTKEHT